MLKQIRADLIVTKDDLSGDLGDLERNLISSIIIRNLILSRGSPHDSLIKHFYFTMDLETLDPKSSTYESLKSFGIDLIGNDSVQKQITTIYEDYLPSLNNEFATVNRAAMTLESLLIPYLTVDTNRLQRSEWAAYAFIDYNNFLQTTDYLVVLQRSIPKRRLQIQGYKSFEKYIEEALSSIEKEVTELEKKIE